MKLVNFIAILLFALPIQASEWNKSNLPLAEKVEITVYRSPSCHCCHRWIEHLEQHQFTVIDKIVQNTHAIKEQVGLPNNLASCHTAIVGDYIVEGHVPADDIKRLLMEKPDISGLSVPEMPVGTPGMEMGDRKDNFAVISYDKNGQYRLFNRYKTDENNSYHSHSH
jgi:hypothetical protein